MQCLATAQCTAQGAPLQQAVSRQQTATRAVLRGFAAPQAQRWAAGKQGAAQQRLQQRRSGGRLAVHASASDYGTEWSTPKDAYLTVGLAHCYVKGDDGKLQDQYVIEPITANSLECMANGAKTSFMHVYSLQLGEAQARNKAVFPPEFASGAFCEDYETRCDACARTWMRPHALDNLLDIVPLGQLKSSFNYSTADKRVLNAEHIVNDDDNIKQDMSIDVYGRKKEEEAAAAAPAAKEEEEEADDMDALLSM